MEKSDNLKNGGEVEQIKGKVRKRLDLGNNDTKTGDFIFHYFLRHFLFVFGLLIFSLVIGYAVIICANYMTNIDMKLLYSGPYILSRSELIYETIAVAIFVFIVSMALWYAAIKRFTNKN